MNEANTQRHAPSVTNTELADRLLAWYDRHRRHLPWRSPPGETADPYHVWLSEIMLQQTTVAAVGPYFRKFLELWPTVHDMAAAPIEDVLAAWAGLGYYARARNLHACAVTVSRELDGRFPDTEAALQDLPGIGAYTSAAIAAIAFDRQATILDGNVERVISRLRSVEDPLPTSKPRLKALATEITPEGRPGDYAQAIMDLGATVCTPRSPKCLMCPWSDACSARVAGIEETLPRKLKKKDKPTRRGTAFFVTDGSGSVLLRRRPPKGLLGGMAEIPSTLWAEAEQADAISHVPVEADWTALPGQVRHTFTHFHLELAVLAGRAEPTSLVDGQWWQPIDQIDAAGLPSVMAKIVRHAVGHLT